MKRIFSTILSLFLATSLLVNSISAQELTPAATKFLLIGKVESLGVSEENLAELLSQIRESLAKLNESIAAKYLLAPMPNNCIEQPGCLDELKKLSNNGYYLKSQVHGLGSLYSVTLELHQLDQSSVQTTIIREAGKRATSTLSETLARSLEKLSEHLTTFTAIQTPVAALPVSQPEISMTSKPWYKKWWIWTILGGVVAGTTTATVLSLTNDNQSSASSITSGRQISVDVDIR